MFTLTEQVYTEKICLPSQIGLYQQNCSVPTKLVYTDKTGLYRHYWFTPTKQVAFLLHSDQNLMQIHFFKIYQNILMLLNKPSNPSIINVTYHMLGDEHVKKQN